MDFRGEEGFTSVSRRRAWGTVHRKFDTACERRSQRAAARASEAPATGRTVTDVAAAERTPGRLIYFLLQSGDPPFPPGGASDFAIATLEEPRPLLNIHRSVKIDPGDASSDNVALPPPFAGTAEYTTGWTGDLTVALPGDAGQALTGPDFIALTRAAAAETDPGRDCEARARKLVRPLFPRH